MNLDIKVQRTLRVDRAYKSLCFRHAVIRILQDNTAVIDEDVTPGIIYCADCSDEDAEYFEKEGYNDQL